MWVSHFPRNECVFVISYFSIFLKRQAGQQNNKLSLILLWLIYYFFFLARGARVGLVRSCEAETSQDCCSGLGSFFNYSRCATWRSTWGLGNLPDIFWRLLVVISAVVRQYLLPRSRGTGETVRTNLEWDDAPYPLPPLPPFLPSSLPPSLLPLLPMNTLCHFRWLLSYCYVLCNICSDFHGEGKREIEPFIPECFPLTSSLNHTLFFLIDYKI